MEMNKIMKEYEKLVEKINEYDYYYYALNNPLIDDYQFDKLYEKLVEIEKNIPILFLRNQELKE
jgi:DNA ligase (NAD+)